MKSGDERESFRREETQRSGHDCRKVGRKVHLRDNFSTTKIIGSSSRDDERTARGRIEQPGSLLQYSQGTHVVWRLICL